MVSTRIFKTGESGSFPQALPFASAAVGSAADVALVLGPDPGSVLAGLDMAAYRAVVVEVGDECLGELTGEDFGREGGKVVGFARYRNGREAPTTLVELVVQPRTEATARETAVALFEDAGLAVAVCNDTPGRIVDRLMRPYFNQVLTAIDRGLAAADDLDRALKLGLGYPRGPVEVLSNGGLAEHCKATAALYRRLGGSEYLPPRGAQVAAVRGAAKGGC
jgi:3-hydroxybutyryl-CoA dehydrogenase